MAKRRQPSLCQQGSVGSILKLGRDSDLPYKRPPLSKDYLAKEKSFERILIRSASCWLERDDQIPGGSAVVEVDPTVSEVELADGERIGFGKLIWSAGGDPRAFNCLFGNDIPPILIRICEEVEGPMAKRAIKLEARLGVTV
jgi:NADPH-dependent 2,4-dienoyl-CoA reductase/sulfur reductase-like enzyme